MKSGVKSPLEELSQVEIFQRVGDICAVVNITLNTEDLLEVSLKQIMELFAAQRGSIFILNEKRDELEVKVAFGMKSGEKAKMAKRMGEGIVGQVAQLKRPIVVDDISTDHRFKDYQPRKSYKTSSFICAPLIVKDALIGVINITDKEHGYRFNENDMQLLDFLSSQIALNYRRIQLYQKFKKVIKETQDLKDRLGESDKETASLKRQIHIHERLASIGKLAGGIAHEFNNPLDGVMRYTNLSLEIVDDEVAKGYLLEIKHGLQRMVSIVKNLLACSRNDMPCKEKVVFEEVLDRTLIVLNHDLLSKNIAISKNIDKKIPTILDLGLERVLLNLIKNAIDAIKLHGRINITAHVKGDYLEINISDSGHGIAKEDIEKIFEPFFTTKDIDKGCGLGLTIVGEIIKSYNGKITVESQLGKGATFSIFIPME